MPIKYLYIDDERTEVLQPLINQISGHNVNGLEVHHKQVYSTFADVVSELKDSHYNGLIIDQKLSAISDQGVKADYYGTTLAQQLRTEMAVGNIQAIPMVLLSNENVIVESYIPDDSSNDLFDFVIKKHEVAQEEKRLRVSKMLHSLIQAYDKARAVKKDIGIDLNEVELCRLFNCNDKQIHYMDTRFLDFIKSKGGDTHSLVASIYSSLIQSAGMLVTEEMLQTKLGVDKNSLDWDKVKQHLDEYKYNGPFCDLKDRWWFSGVEDWWDELYPENVLQNLTVKERVAILIEKLSLPHLNYVELSYSEGQQSEYLWVNCVLSGVALDPYDALRVRDPEAKVWEQPKYIDLRAFLNDDEHPHYKIHIDDKDKVKKLIARLKPNVNE
ncbi:hypothetical protein [Enterobacter cloacae complex sp. 2021EL-01169]|uniref:hypothetical protein n=1 Tax=Enterobacter cloacae complex sp. 2021EL-01169 TaxID=2887193 RepID=UPI001D152072|nr:hypothetical protein [Enterobacter cloacae complex sp. 2021EL-01169]MCC3241889.1 hypothetical protein [Enterobacter cloacae complex sp. 2021EL-01169]